MNDVMTGRSIITGEAHRRPVLYPLLFIQVRMQGWKLRQAIFLTVLQLL